MPQDVDIPESTVIPQKHVTAFTFNEKPLTVQGKLIVYGVTGRNIYELIKVNPKISYSQIAAILKLSRKTVSRNIASLREKGLIQFEGNPRNGEWKVLKEYPNE